MHESTGTIAGYGENYLESFLPFLHSKEDIKKFLEDLKVRRRQLKKIIKDGYKHRIKNNDSNHINMSKLLLCSLGIAFGTALAPIVFGQMPSLDIVSYFFSSLAAVTAVTDVIYLNIKSGNMAEDKMDLVTGVLKTQLEDDEDEEEVIVKKEERKIEVTGDLQNEIEICISKAQKLKYDGYLNDLIRLYRMLKLIIMNDDKLDFTTQLSFTLELEKINNRINNAIDEISLSMETPDERIKIKEPEKDLILGPINDN